MFFIAFDMSMCQNVSSDLEAIIDSSINYHVKLQMIFKMIFSGDYERGWLSNAFTIILITTTVVKF